MIRAILPPALLFLALASFIAGFGVLAFGAPEETVQLHAARVGGDDAALEQLEDQLARDRARRRMLIGSLFGAGILLGLGAFGAMRNPADHR